MTQQHISVGTTTRSRCARNGHQVFVKRPSKLPHMRMLAEIAGLTKAEVRFYLELSRDVPVRVPKLVSGHHGPFDFELVLEDLTATGCRLPVPGDSLSLDDVGKVLQALAALHTHYWESPAFFGPLQWLGKQQRREETLSSIGRPLLELGLRRAGSLVTAPLRQGLRRYAASRRTVLRKLAAGPCTLVHHDCHPGNLFFTPDGLPGLLDWQLVRQGSWATDVAYLLATALTVQDRRTSQTDLLGRYLDRIPEAQRPDLQQAKELISGHTAYALEAMVLTLGLGPVMHGDDIETLVVRAASAAADAGSFAKLC